MAEEKEEHKEHHKTSEEHHEHHKKKSGVNFWMMSTLILVIVLLIVVGVSFSGMIGNGSSSNTKVLTADQVGKNAKAYIETNLIPPGSTIAINNVTETDGVYLISSTYQGQQIPIYMTADGKYMFLSAVDITKPVPSSNQTQPSQNIQKSDKPKVELFVMSFCPYGVQAEQVMIPVYELLKNSVDFNIKFIVNIGGNTTDSVQSLHGANEAKEDLRQICIMKYYPDKYWNYLAEFDNNCPSKLNDATGLDACWQAAATKFGIDVNKTSTCAYSSEGLSLLAADEQASNAYGVSGSPTLIINGGEYSGGRTPDAYKTSICSAFNTAPAACNQTVGSANSTSTTASGGCAA
jgi:protein-disulfide isomerase